MLGPFRDQPESRFYQAPGLSPEETWEAVRQRLARALDEVQKEAWRRPLRPDAERIRRWHGAIFRPLFRYEGGKFRQAHEPAFFGVPALVAGKPAARRLEGAPAADIVRQLAKVCEEFNGALDALAGRRGVEIIEVARAAAALYAGILRTHPFVDGNHRAGFVALSAALWSFRFPNVEFATEEEVREHDELLAYALLPEVKDPEPFAKYVAERIKAAVEAGR